MADESFFDERTESSRIKTEIVTKYFWAWAKIILPHVQRRGSSIAYVDLFSGPGAYKDGTKSTPLLILETAIKEPNFCDSLRTFFNDIDPQNSASLLSAIDNLPGIERLKYQPIVANLEVGQEVINRIVQAFSVPTLFFVDPWGYKGLSIRLISSLLGGWGSDGILFFNYRRINMTLHNPVLKAHMDGLFGEVRATKLREQIEPLSPIDREQAIIDAVRDALAQSGGKYVQPFRFSNQAGSRTSHHVIFVSKHPLGYDVMKDIMAKLSSTKEQGVAGFEFNPADASQPALFDVNTPLDDLERMLLRDFAGQMLTMEKLFHSHHVGKKYVEANYKAALLSLEVSGKITCDPPSAKRRQGTFGRAVKITFPDNQG